MQVYLLLIFTCMMFSVPSKQQSSTNALFENIGFGAIFLVFDHFENCWNEGEEIQIFLIYEACSLPRMRTPM
jgi:hypothetical protein